jgi:hypothetical protein
MLSGAAMARPDDDDFIDVFQEIAGARVERATADPTAPSRWREHDDGTLGTPPLGEPLSSTPLSPADHVGPGRGELHDRRRTARADG